MKVRDVMTKIVHPARKNDKVGDVAEPVTTIAPDDDLEDASQMMKRDEIRRLPVVENGRLVGVLSLGNLVQRAGNDTAMRATEGVTRGA